MTAAAKRADGRHADRAPPAPGSAGTTAPAAPPRETRRARIGRSSTNRRRSSASAAAVAYRAAGSRAIALATIVSRSRGTPGASFFSRSGSSCSTRSISAMPVRRLERRPQRHQLVERQAQAVHVGPRVALPREPLRGHVADGAQDVAGVRQVVGLGRLGQAEVGHPDVAVVVQQEVRRLDVAVEDALAVGVLQRLGHLDADPGDACGRYWRSGSDEADSSDEPGRTAEEGSAGGPDSPATARRRVVAGLGHRPVRRRPHRRRTGRRSASGPRRPPSGRRPGSPPTLRPPRPGSASRLRPAAAAAGRPAPRPGPARR